MSNLSRLRDAVVGRGREVEVTPNGEVREASPEAEPQSQEGDAPDEARAEKPAKPTRLAPHTWGEDQAG